MNKKFMIGTIAASMILQTATPAFAGGKDVIGGIIGGVVGGVIGSNIGKGDGNTAAIIVGAIAGSLIGGELGRELDQQDRQACGDAQNRALRDQLGRREDWRGGRSGAYGSFTTTREGYNYRTGEYCREYRSEIYLRNGRREVQTGIACSRSNSWYEVQSSQVDFGSRRPPRYPGPGPIQPGPRPGPVMPGPGPVRPTPPPPINNGSQSSAQVSGITRRTGGEWIRLNLSNPVNVRDIQVRVLSYGLRIHEAVVYTETGARLSVREFNETRVLYAGESAISEILNIPQRITAVDLRIESMGGYSDALLSLDTERGFANLSVSRF